MFASDSLTIVKKLGPSVAFVRRTHRQSPYSQRLLNVFSL